MTISAKHLTAITVLATLWVLEALIPFFTHQHPNLRERVLHDLRNFAWGGVNLALGAVFVSTVLVTADSLAQAHDWGLLRWVELPSPAGWVVAFVLLDVWMYVWHRLNHEMPLLWRFHRMHHSDMAMDVSTGVRFHTGEIVLSGIARLVVVPLLGISIEQLLVYEAVMLPVVLLHHSNVRLPRWLDYGLAWVIVSPAVHRVHHSHLPAETNSNYGSVFPWWDWLFRSLRMRRDVENIVYGLDEFQGSAASSLRGMAITPLADSSNNATARD